MKSIIGGVDDARALNLFLLSLTAPSTMGAKPRVVTRGMGERYSPRFGGSRSTSPLASA